MFYCDECKKKHDLEDSYVRSFGRCELCGNSSDCQDGFPKRKEKANVTETRTDESSNK